VFRAPWPAGSAEYVVVNLEAEGLNAGEQIAVDPADSPATFLMELAGAWRGWKGPKAWQCPGGNLSMRAYHDGVGVVAISATLGMWNGEEPATDGDWRATGVIVLEPGSLEQLTETLAAFLGHKPVRR
jgi:hypothetical protein